MKKAELDALSVGELMDLPDETVMEDFDKQNWRSVWFQAVETWWGDEMQMYHVMRDGFKGFLDRSDFTIYCDLRYTFVEGQSMSWDDLAKENHELGKYS